MMIERYAHSGISHIFSDRYRYDLWAEIEQAANRHLFDRGLVPVEIPHWVPDIERIAEFERVTGHDVVAFIADARLQVPAEAAPWVHYGLTSSDIVDTALAVQLVEATGVLGNELRDLLAALDIHVDSTLEQTGRTHLQPAYPATWGRRCSQWLSEIRAGWADLADAASRAARGKVSGPDSAHRIIPPEVERETLGSFGLEPSTYGWQAVPRSIYRLYLPPLAHICNAISKIVTDLRLMLLTGEISNSHCTGSSSMPHKQNPIWMETVSGLCTLGAHLASTPIPGMWLERDICHSSVERVIYPDMFHIVCTATARVAHGVAQVEPHSDPYTGPDSYIEQIVWGAK